MARRRFRKHSMWNSACPSLRSFPVFLQALDDVRSISSRGANWHGFMCRISSLLAALLSAGCGAGAQADANGPLLGTPPVRFLTRGALDLWPCFSPDGTRILFSRRVGDTWELYLVPVAGGAAVKLAASPLPVAATRGNWSRQSNMIAFTGTSSNGKSRVWLIKPDGWDAQELEIAGLPDKVFYPSWYPDGKQIAVMDAASYSIARIDRATKDIATRITDPTKVYTGMPSVSPDGKWIAFAGQPNMGQPYDQSKNSIWLLGKSGGPRLVEFKANQGRAPTWSPSGGQLLFESNRSSNQGLYAIFVINRDGTGIAQLTDPALNADHPVWSPDGLHVAFSAHDPTQLGAGRGIGTTDWPESGASTASR
jgi:Tol biopolymer transport system component